MVRRAFWILLTFTLSSTSILFAAGKDPAAYQIGDTTEADIITPVRLVVVDEEATATLKEREAQRVPVIYRFYPRTIDEVQAAFQSTFATTRSNFLDAVERAFGRRELSADDLSSTNFQRFLTAFQRQNILFPVGTNLAALWASGQSAEAVESDVASRLRETMRAYIRSDIAAPDIWVGSTLRLVSLADNEVLTARLVEERGNNVNKNNFVSEPRAKTELQNSFPPHERAVGRYLASFVKPNCLMEAELTRELRAKRTEGLVVTDEYEAGQIIARRGQTIDRKIKDALTQLVEKSAVTKPQPAAEIIPVSPPRTPEKPASDPAQTWLVVAASVAFLGLVAIIWQLVRRQPVPLLPAPIPGGPLDAADEAWRQRALLAEEQARKAQAAARAGLLSHLSRWLSQKLTRQLVSQRTQLLDAHQSAAVEIAELEARLEKVHAPLQERLKAYELRIAELEKELTVKGEENRELIKAKILITRKQLEMERAKTRLEFN